MIELNCNKYNAKVKKYIKTVCFKDYLIKLFIQMMNYNIDSKLIFMMKDLILVNLLMKIKEKNILLVFYQMIQIIVKL